MSATLTLNFDNNTGKGFKELLAALDSADKATVSFNETNQEASETGKEGIKQLQTQVTKLREELARMEGERATAVKAIQKENSFLREAAVQVAGDAASGAGRAGVEWVRWRLKVIALKIAVRQAALAVGGAAATAVTVMAPVVATYVAAKAAVEGWKFVLENTDLKIEQVGEHTKKLVQFTEEQTDAIARQAGIVAHNNEELAKQLNAIQDLEQRNKTLQKVTEATGQSLDGMGLKASSNASEIGEAWDRLSNRLSEPFRHGKQAFMDWWNSSSIVQDALDSLSQGAENFETNVSGILDSIGDDWDELRVQVARVGGANAEEYRKEIKELRKLEEARSRVAEAQEKSAAHFEKLGQLNRALQEEVKWRNELERVQNLNKNQLDAELTLIQERAGKAAAAGQFLGKTEQEYTQLFWALHNRRKELQKQEVENSKKLAKEHAEWLKQNRERQIAEEDQAAQRRLEIEQEHLAKVKQLREQAAQHAINTSLNIKQEIFKNIDARLQHEADAITKAVENERSADRDVTALIRKREDKWNTLYESRREQIKNTLDAELQAADSEYEKRESLHKARVNLYKLDAEEKRAAEARKVADAEMAAKREFEVERKKIEAIKGLRDNQGKNLFEHLAGKQGPQAVFEEITRRRLAESHQKNPNATGEQRLREDRAIRQKVQREFAQGKVSPAEIAKVQADLAARQILAANAQGKVSQRMMQGLREQAKTSAETIALQQEMEQQLEQLEKVQNAQQQAVRGSRQRMRGKRAGFR